MADGSRGNDVDTVSALPCLPLGHVAYVHRCNLGEQVTIEPIFLHENRPCAALGTDAFLELVEHNTRRAPRPR
jgi:hypothetical protein